MRKTVLTVLLILLLCLLACLAACGTGRNAGQMKTQQCLKRPERNRKGKTPDSRAERGRVWRGGNDDRSIRSGRRGIYR